MSLKVYHVEGVRNCAVIFATSPEEAAAQAMEPHLLAVVNELNTNRNGRPHAAEFEHFRLCLCLAPERTHLLSWQELLTRAEPTFDSGVRPLLGHAGRLSYLQPM